MCDRCIGTECVDAEISVGSFLTWTEHLHIMIVSSIMRVLKTVFYICILDTFSFILWTISYFEAISSLLKITRILHRIDKSSHHHDDVIKWKHFPRYWLFVWGIHRPPVNSPHKGQWRGALMFSLICARINGWVNNRKGGGLRRHRAHYDVIAMISWNLWDEISYTKKIACIFFKPEYLYLASNFCEDCFGRSNK